jgi:hypothetical protein
MITRNDILAVADSLQGSKRHHTLSLLRPLFQHCKKPAQSSPTQPPGSGLAATGIIVPLHRLTERECAVNTATAAGEPVPSHPYREQWHLRVILARRKGACSFWSTTRARRQHQRPARLRRAAKAHGHYVPVRELERNPALVVATWRWRLSARQGVLGLSALETGFAYVPITGMFFAMVYVVRPLVNRLGRPVLLIASLVVALAGMIWLAQIDAHSPYFPDVVLPLLVIGVGQGIAIILMTQAGVSDVEPADAGAASGLVNVAHQLGGSLGIAILTIVFAAAAGDTTTQDPTMLAAGFHATFTGAAVFYVLAVALAVAVFLGTRSTARHSAAVSPSTSTARSSEPERITATTIATPSPPPTNSGT